MASPLLRTSHVVPGLLLATIAAGLLARADGPLAAAQFPGQGDNTQRSTTILDRERRERASRVPEDDRPRIMVPGKDDRIQIDRWTYSPAVSGVDPLTQIVRFTLKNSSGTGFLLDDCRVMTNLHVISEKEAVEAGELVGEEFEFESQPIPWFDNARAVGRVIILGHGSGRYMEGTQIRSDNADQDWAIGYDLGCASRTYDLGILHLGAPVRSLSDLADLKTFAAGYTGVRMPGQSPWEFPLYIDTNCKPFRKSTVTSSPSHYETDCSLEKGGSGQPLLSGLLADPQNPNVFRSERGRPRLMAFGLFHAGGGYNADVPNFLSRSFMILFDEEMMRRFAPFLRGPVNVAALRRHPRPTDTARIILSLDARYTEDARRRRVEGRIVINFDVRADGSVQRATLAGSLDPGGLDELALAAAQRWRFEPARSNGIAIPQTVHAPAFFRLPPD